MNVGLKNLIYLCLQLLIQSNGIKTLRDYKGIGSKGSKPELKPEVDAIVAAYLEEVKIVKVDTKSLSQRNEHLKELVPLHAVSSSITTFLNSVSEEADDL